MERWLVVTLLVAMLFGLYHVFTKLAAGRLPDAVGAFWLEGLALIGVGVFLVITRQSLVGPAVTKTGLIFALAAGACVGLGTVLNFTIYRLQGSLSVAGPIVLLGAVVIMAVAGILLFKEQLTISKAAGWLCAIAAIWLLSR